MKKIIFNTLILLSFQLFSNAQQTVGIFMNSQEAFDGYTLLDPHVSFDAYLINNCGEKVHEWNSDYKPGLSSYLLENGVLLRSRQMDNPDFQGGGSGGGIEMLDWDGNVIWEYTISDESQCQHHDIEYLPNGNILAIVWDLRTAAEAEQAGRIDLPTEFWSEKIIEIQPDLVNGGGTIVWEWYLWDHLIQDADPSKDNYGNIADSPELIDININPGAGSPDWMHFNGLDYNAELDQIIISGLHLSEFIIIDHSTTTAEAAGHTGGNSNKGGDIIYRWGNPENYGQGTENDRKLFRQHHAHWIENGLQDEGMIMVFNNRAGIPTSTDFSAINVVNPPVDNNGNYTMDGAVFGPSTSHWTYVADPVTDFFSGRVSGAQRLPNGNTLICEGSNGRLFEVDYDGNMVWEYINPSSAAGIINQGTDPVGNATFRCLRYSEDYPAFDGKTLSPQGYIETGSDNITCDLFVHNNNINNIEWNISPNPSTDLVQIQGDILNKNIELIDVSGKVITNKFINNNTFELNINHIPNGIYFIKIYDNNHNNMGIQKIVKM